MRVAAAAALLGMTIHPLQSHSQEPVVAQRKSAPSEEIAVPPAPQPLPAVLIPPAPSIDEPVHSEVFIPPAPSRDRNSAAENEEWTIAIVPMEKRNTPSLISNYEAVYKAIPYRRAEYLANPSYRHDTTVEVLFGQMRNMVINRNDTPERVVNPRPQMTQPYPISKGELYSYWPLLQYSSPLPLLSPIQ